MTGTGTENQTAAELNDSWYEDRDKRDKKTVEKLTSDFKDCLISNVNIFVF